MIRRAIRPQKGPQETFLGTSADIGIYGGGAFGGKTWSLLLEPIRHTRNPHFGGVIFRRTSPQITNEGGLWDESEKLYPLAGAEGLVGSLDWRFPSGMNIGFRHLQHEKNKYDWQGAQLGYLGFDELTHFSDSQFWYMISRVRSTSGVRPYVRATCNPEPGWVREFLAQWVDRTHPDPAASGELRYLVRVQGKLEWSHSAEESRLRFPSLRPRSVTFVRACIYDNPAGMSADPDYIGNLQALPDVERKRLLDGDWDVRRDGLIYPGLADCVVDLATVPAGRRIGGIDFGWNHPFCALAGVVDHDDVLWVTFERYKSFSTLPTHSEALPRDGTLWHADPSRPDSIAELGNAGHLVVPCVHKGKKPVLTGIDMVSDRIRTSRLKVSRACQNLLRAGNLVIFDKDGEPLDEDNDATDALRYLVVGLDRGRSVPRPPPRIQTAAELAAIDAAAAEEAKRKRAELMDVDNPIWWGDNDE